MIEDQDSLAGNSDSEEPHDKYNIVAAVAALPDVLEYVGEFGVELVLFLPFCNWLSGRGLLKRRRIKTYIGMNCFYEDLDCLEIIYKNEKRTYVAPDNRPAFLPIKNEHNFDNIGRSPFHLFPDLRAKFINFRLPLQLAHLRKPLLIVHNKYNDEWNLGPLNFIPIRTLNLIFNVLKNEFTIVYVRHGIRAQFDSYTEDHNDPLPFEDAKLLESHPEVLCFEALFQSHLLHDDRQDINRFKNILYSRCFHFITAQGGGAHHIAQFSESLLIIFHIHGSEVNWAYGEGYYNFMAAVPPTRVICRSEIELVRAIPLLFSPR